MDHSHNQSLEDIDRRTVLHANTDLAGFAAGTAEGTIITGAEGIRIRDSKGREWIDAVASLWCVNIGYGRREIAEVLHRQTLDMAYYHSHAGHSSEPVIRLTDNAGRMGERLRRGLRAALGDHDHVGDVRGEGLLACIEFVADRNSRAPFDPALGIGPRLAQACREEGVIVRACRAATC